MPVDEDALLKDLQRRVKLLEKDLKERVKDVPALLEALKAEHAEARAADRTAESFVAWRDATLTQAAAAWVLACTFVRFLEDNELIDEPLIAGPGERGELAAERRDGYFRVKHDETDRDYLYDCFRTVAALPGMASLYDERHNPVWRIGISGDAAKELIQFWRARVPETGELVHDFTDPAWDTRFLGDLYQDLSESVRKRYALLQTPDFIEEFILERTLLPALDEFGLEETRMIDPTCGSGHFLLGGFRILLDRWQKKEPSTPERELVQRSLDGVFGVDINPYATAVARFRLMVAALRASQVEKLTPKSPAFRINVATGDSLLHGPWMLTAADALSSHGVGRTDLGLEGDSEQMARAPGIGHAFESEDLSELNRILGQHYHAVVGNPPYITVKDRMLGQLYRRRYSACHRKYALVVPFLERFFQLAVSQPGDDRRSGFVGAIVANSFMAREFGKKLIEDFLSKIDVHAVVDTSGAYLPGHGTPTLILFGRDRSPVNLSIDTVLGIRGEPARPPIPRDGLVWQEIVKLINGPPAIGNFVEFRSISRSRMIQHPWSLSGGGASELSEIICQAAKSALSEEVSVIGVLGMTNANNVMLASLGDLRRKSVSGKFLKPLCAGDDVRDWGADCAQHVIFPYGANELLDPRSDSGTLSWLWPNRTTMGSRATFAKNTYFEEGRPWWEWHQVTLSRLQEPLSITYAEIVTHNHFVLDRGDKVFNQTAPVIKLSKDATEAHHLSLLGLLNSSTACFWMKQVFHNKGVGGIGGGIGDEGWEPRYVFTGTGLKKFPLPTNRPTVLATRLDRLASEH